MAKHPVRLGRSESGATAIEYAIIGALIGIGLVGSLVTTRGSLNSIFGVASSQMGSANAGAAAGALPAYTERPAPAASSSTRASFWSAKTLASSTSAMPDPQTKVNTFTYTDGAVVNLTRKYDASGALTGETLAIQSPGLSGSTPDSGTWTFNASGVGLTQDYYQYYSANGPVMLHETQSASDGYISHELWYNSNGSFQRSYNSPAGTYSAVDPRAPQDEIYFRALSQ